MAHTEISWLNDAHATKVNLVEVLENHAKDAKNHLQLQAKIQQHLEQSRHHTDLVKGCIERLGGSTSAVKSAMG